MLAIPEQIIAIPQSCLNREHYIHHAELKNSYFWSKKQRLLIFLILYSVQQLPYEKYIT